MGWWVFEGLKAGRMHENPIEMGSSYLCDSYVIFLFCRWQLASKLIRVRLDGIQQFLCKFFSSHRGTGGREIQWHNFHMNSYGTWIYYDFSLPPSPLLSISWEQKKIQIISSHGGGGGWGKKDGVGVKKRATANVSCLFPAKIFLQVIPTSFVNGTPLKNEKYLEGCRRGRGVKKSDSDAF